MFGLSKLFSKKDPAPGSEMDQASITTQDWYRDRYDKIIVQRNILLVLIVCCLIIVSLSVIGIVQLSTTRDVKPFVVQIQDTTGEIRVANPVSAVVSSDDEIAKYFIRQYVIARETYNTVDFDTNAKQIVRLMSTPNIYYQYLSYFKSKDHDPRIIYSDKNSTYLTIKSWSKLNHKKYILRFSIRETADQMRQYDKIAIVDIDYVAMKLSDDERTINPIGFQVQGYRSDDDKS